ncbi:MAG: hypothetical protein IPH94_16245 [Saprospiraceae bacterium]|nr:hypothetical protein [Saprospiraceae bacterium]MBK7789019.1 hypothetical protein [Saprospiraceae bacterium]
MQKIGIYSFLILAMTSLLSCGKDKIEEETWEVPDEPRIIVESARMVTGITDENGLPLDGLTAAFNDTIRLVDKGDYFQFKGTQLNKRGEILRLTDKEGQQYHFTQRPIENDVAYFQQVIIRNKATLVQKSHIPLELPLTNETQINIAPNQYRKSVQSYSGDVIVEYFSYDLDREIHRAALPGGVTGIDKTGKRALLKMATAFSINCKTPNAEYLEFTSAYLNSSLLNQDNTLFHYNEKIGNWEAVDNETGALNTAVLSKPGYYCIAKPVTYVQLKGSLYLGGNPAPNQKVTISYSGSAQTLFTANSGKWEALIPTGEEVSYTYDLPCFAEAKTIGPSGVDILLSTDSPTQNTQNTRFTGQLLNCLGQKLDNGFLQVQGNDFYKTIYLEGGSIDFVLPHCQSDKISVRAYDAETGESGSQIEWKPGVDNQMYNVFACTQMAEPYFEVHNGEGSVIYTQFNQIKVQDRVQLQAKNINGGNNELTLVFPAAQQGIQPNGSINLIWNDSSFAGKGISVNCANSINCGFEKFDITHLADVQDGWIRAQFKARMWSKILNTLEAGYVEVEGSFQIKRSF